MAWSAARGGDPVSQIKKPLIRPNTKSGAQPPQAKLKRPPPGPLAGYIRRVWGEEPRYYQTSLVDFKGSRRLTKNGGIGMPRFWLSGPRLLNGLVRPGISFSGRELAAWGKRAHDHNELAALKSRRAKSRKEEKK